MTKQPSPDRRLIYLHCSSIFSGANAQVRRQKVVLRLIQQHKASIKILTNEFTLPAIAAVAKELLEERLFESLPRAKLRFPELFQTSEVEEAERAASEAEAVRIAAEAAQDIVLTSDDDGGDDFPDCEQGEQRVESAKISKDENKAPDKAQIGVVGPRQVSFNGTHSPAQAHEKNVIPRLHPVYLPFKTQHKILVLVQSLLEECCLEFGNSWIPDLMEAQNWHEVESIELTQWIKKVAKLAKSLPPSATKPIAGKSIAQVLFGSSSLRHSAVHRLPTSAAGVLNMLSAAIEFAEALNDLKRAEKVAEIKARLESSIEEIVQHQNLLQRKLTDQLEDIARRRAELDNLEKSAVEEMLATDQQHRIDTGSTLEGFLAGFQQVSNPCVQGSTPSFGGPKAGSEAGEISETSGIGHEYESPHGLDEDQTHNTKVFGEEKPVQDKELEKDSGGVFEEEPVLEMALPTLRLRGKPGDASPPIIRGKDLEQSQNKPLELDALPDVPDHMAKEAISVEELCFTESKETLHSVDSCISAPDEQPLTEDALLVYDAVPKGDFIVEEEEATPTAALEASPAEQVIQDSGEVGKGPFNHYGKIANDLDDLYEPTAESKHITAHDHPPKDFKFPISPSGPSMSTVRRNTFHPVPPSAPSSTSLVTAKIEAVAAPKALEDSHTITLKILSNSQVLRSVVWIRACTRTAILNEARSYCMKCAQDDPSLLGTPLLANGWDLAIVSLRMYDCEMDMSTYKVENLSSLVRTIEKTGIPMFTLRILEV